MHDGTIGRRAFLLGACAAGGAIAAGGSFSVNAQHHEHLAVRKEIRSLRPRELVRLRRAFRALQRMSSVGDYQDLAGYHGVPRRLCHTDSRLFLPWHRAYIYHFEQALRRIDNRVTLPYWDWTSAESIGEGIPPALADPTCRIAGQVVPNPLFAATIRLEGDRPTNRIPGQPIELSNLAQRVQAAFQQYDFLSFSRYLDSPHGGLHTWVKGSMGSVPYAAYDPIFWVHHANVDFQWARWQAGRNNSDPPTELMSLPLPGFDMRVESVVHYQHDLGYTYEGLTPSPPLIPLWSLADGPTFQATLKSVDAPRPRVLLVAHNLREGAHSFSIRVFVNQPEADAQTRLEGNPNFAGTFGVFGHGRHRHDLHEAQNMPVVDLTDAIDRVAAEKQKASDIKITLVPLNMQGTLADISAMPFSHVSVQQE